MVDIEKVYHGLWWCSKCTNEDPFNGCDECPYNEVGISVQECRAELCLDALELLKEQEQEYLVQHEEGFHDGYGQALMELYRKQFEKVVRCKDCKWRNTSACFCKTPTDVRDDWFCSEGERK